MTKLAVGLPSRIVSGKVHVQVRPKQERDSACDHDATDFQLKDKGILGNGHFMMLETNRKQVFDAINTWILTKVPPPAHTAHVGW